jgi:hypothetical protein
MTFAFSRMMPLRLPFMLLAGAAALAACSTAAPPPVALAPAVIPPHAAAPPPVALSSRVVEHASEFRTYMKRAASITPNFNSGASIEDSLERGESFEPQQLSRGAIAYAAVIALQEPGFVAGVRTYAVDPEGRKAMAQRLMADPYYATGLPGASAAAGLIIASLQAEGARVRGAGELVKQSAYDVQHQAWSKEFITDPTGRLAHAKAVSSTPMSPEPADVAQLSAAVTGDAKAASSRFAVEAGASSPPYTQVVTRGLAVAALAALGEGGDENDAAVESLLTDSNGGFCLNMSKLNLYQCLAVAKPWYEDIFCLGQHVLIDTGQCISKAAGGAPPVQSLVAAAVPIAEQAPASAKPAAKARKKAHR